MQPEPCGTAEAKAPLLLLVFLALRVSTTRKPLLPLRCIELLLAVVIVRTDRLLAHWLIRALQCNWAHSVCLLRGRCQAQHTLQRINVCPAQSS